MQYLPHTRFLHGLDIIDLRTDTVLITKLGGIPQGWGITR